MRITLIRHLPTEWNQNTWLQGRRDIPISQVTEDRIKGVIRNQDKLIELSPFDLVLASSLSRTQQTAKVYEMNPIIEPLLDELDFGPYEGRPKQELLNDYGLAWSQDPLSIVLGERVYQLEERIIEFLAKYNQYENILVFGHGSWIRAIISYAKHGTINHMNQITVANNECISLEFMTVR